MDRISPDHVLKIFDQLVAEGTIVYGPYTSRVIHDEGYPMEFRICPALTKKPHTVGAKNDSFSHTRKWGPGSDLFCPDERLVLCKVNDTHDLALNLFCVDRPQLLMVTRDSYRRQHEPLDRDDFTAMLELVRTWEGWYVIFNCGEKGGCSRVHKHVQGLKGPPYAFEALLKAERGEGVVPFKFFLHRFEEGFKDVSVQQIIGIYEQMLAKSRLAIGLAEGEVCPHNVVLWDDCIVVIPRRKGVWEWASANTGGMMGSVWVSNETEVHKWTRLGCANVLRELGVPR